MNFHDLIIPWRLKITLISALAYKLLTYYYYVNIQYNFNHKTVKTVYLFMTY